MNKLILAAAATALCATSTSFAAPAEAGMRMGGGFGFRQFHFRPYFSSPPTTYSAPDEDEIRARRRSVHKSEKSAPKKEAKVPLVKFADGTGRQYDPASKVWFDGKGQCFSGKHAFTYKNGAWFYGASRWTQSDGNWVSSADAQPELVSCDSVPSFAAKANAKATKAVAQGEKQDSAPKSTSDQPVKAPNGSAPKIKTAEGDTAAIASTPAAAPATECKKYFPSVGQMLTVPCGE